MKKNITVSLLMLLLVFGAIGCTDTAEEKDQKIVEEQQDQYRIAQPIPYFDWSLERSLAIQLYEARNEKVATHTVWRSDTGMVEGDCPSIGYPLPYDTSLTNPLQTANSYRSSPVIEQPEPNGLYSSKNSIATWVRCVCEVNGKVIEAPIYIESKVTTYPYPVTVDYENNRVYPVENVMPSVVISY